MKLKKLISAMAGLACAAVTSQAALTLNYAAVPGAAIQFNGAARTFQFNQSSLPGFFGQDWNIINEAGTPPPAFSAIGLFGSVFDGPFNYGPVTTVGSDQFATVTGPAGTLAIHDGTGHDLTANVNWIEVRTSSFIGGLNATLNVNVSGFAYVGGVNPDLVRLVTEGNANGGRMNLAFQFSPGMTLTDLSSGNGPYITSYAGSISTVPVPEPTTMIAGALLLLPFAASTLRMVRKNRTA
jgi:hypothetical protein